MGATLSNTALSRQLINESRKSTDKPIKIRAEWNFKNHSKNDFAIRRITALTTYYDCSIYSTSIGSNLSSVILHFYDKNEIISFKNELKTTHPTIKLL